MKMRAAGSIAAAGFLVFAIFAAGCGGVARAQGARLQCLGSRDLASPDGALIARVTRTGRGACGESRLEIFDADGHLRAEADYSSSDGEHGAGVAQAAWSADSRFLVYSLADQGVGGTPKYRIDFYRAETNHVRPITVLQPDLVVARPEFKFGEGDAIEVAARTGAVSVHLESR